MIMLFVQLWHLRNGQHDAHNENWYIRLLMEATDRMEINQTKVASNHRLVSYSDYADDRILLLDPASDFLDQYIEKEMVRDFLGCLTARQKEIIHFCGY